MYFRRNNNAALPRRVAKILRRAAKSLNRELFPPNSLICLSNRCGRSLFTYIGISTDTVKLSVGRNAAAHSRVDRRTIRSQKSELIWSPIDNRGAAPQRQKGPSVRQLLSAQLYRQKQSAGCLDAINHDRLQRQRCDCY